MYTHKERKNKKKMESVHKKLPKLQVSDMS